MVLNTINQPKKDYSSHLIGQDEEPLDYRADFRPAIWLRVNQAPKINRPYYSLFQSNNVKSIARLKLHVKSPGHRREILNVSAGILFRMGIYVEKGNTCTK